jgi:hypothetical protein
MLTIRGIREVQAGGAYCRRRSSLIGRRPVFEGWRGPARRVLVILVFLAQLFVPSAQAQGPLLSAPSTAAADSSLAAVNFATADSAVPCSHHHAEAAGLAGEHGKAPCCPNGGCPCPCSHPIDAAAIALPPPDSAQAVYAPLLSKAVSIFQIFGSIRQPADFVGRPRGPPISI